MAPQRKRPISVWIAQILLAIYGVGGLLMVLWGLYRGFTQGIPNPELYIVTTVGLLAFNAVFLGGFWGMAIQKSWGRWLGVAGIAIFLIGAGVTLVSRWKSGDWGAPYLLFSVLVVIGLCFLLYKLAAGDAAEEFFNGGSNEVGL